MITNVLPRFFMNHGVQTVNLEDAHYV